MPNLLVQQDSQRTLTKASWFFQDGTLALQKSSAPWPRDENDWVLYNKKVPGKLQELVKDGYRVVIFRYLYSHQLECSICWPEILLKRSA